MTSPPLIFFDYWLTYTEDRTPGRHAHIGMQAGPVTVELDHDLEALTRDENLAAAVLHKTELQFIEWVGDHHPGHRLANWEARLGSAEGPVVSHYRSGFYASE